MKKAILKTFVVFIIYNTLLFVSNPSYSQTNDSVSIETTVDSAIKDSGMIKIVVHNNLAKIVDSIPSNKQDICVQIVVILANRS